MSRYDANRSADQDGWGGGFEDPRFAGGRRPDDDNEGFDNVFGGVPRGGGGRVGCGCFLTLLGLGAAAAIVCCGGLAWFGLQDRADRVAAALAADPAFHGPLEDALGEDYRLTPDMAATLDAPQDAAVFEATGSRGSGRLTAFVRQDRDVDPGADPRAMTALSGTLQLDDGRTIELLPEDPSPQEGMQRLLEEMRRLENLRPDVDAAPAPDEGPNGDEPADEPPNDRFDAFEDGDR